MAKQEAFFESVIGWGKHPYTGDLNVSLRRVTGHPVLGSEDIVHTSRVEKIGYSDDGKVLSVETANTIYRVAQ